MCGVSITLLQLTKCTRANSGTHTKGKVVNALLLQVAKGINALAPTTLSASTIPKDTTPNIHNPNNYQTNVSRHGALWIIVGSRYSWNISNSLNFGEFWEDCKAQKIFGLPTGRKSNGICTASKWFEQASKQAQNASVGTPSGPGSGAICHHGWVHGCKHAFKLVRGVETGRLISFFRKQCLQSYKPQQAPTCGGSPYGARPHLW